MICWRCHEPVQGPVCAGCGAIQPPRPDPDLYEVLGIERRYHLDPKAVDAAWREISRKVHPDRFSGRSAVERRMSLQWTATVNEAKRVLRDPRLRAHYLATGRPEPAEDGGPRLDPDFLEAVFDLQMLAAEDPIAVSTQAGRMKSELEVELDATFRAWEEGGSDLSRAEELLARLRYLDKTLAQVSGS